MVVGKVETVEGVSGEWLSEERRDHKNSVREGSSPKRCETGLWKRTIFVQDGMQPTDIVESYPFDLPFPVFYAGIPEIKKRKVEYVASAMANPDLRCERICSFSVARYQRASIDLPKISVGGLCFEPQAYMGERVLVEGHHSFLAFLLCGLPPSELQPIRINMARYRVERLFPWWMVTWSI